MAKKKTKKGKEKKTSKRGKVKEYLIEVSQTRSDIETFIDKFKSDVDKKKKEYQLYTRKLRKRK